MTPHPEQPPADVEKAVERVKADLDIQDSGGMVYPALDAGVYTVVIQGEDLRLLLSDHSRRGEEIERRDAVAAESKRVIHILAAIPRPWRDIIAELQARATKAEAERDEAREELAVSRSNPCGAGSTSHAGPDDKLSGGGEP